MRPPDGKQLASPWPTVLWGLLVLSFLGSMLPSFRNEYFNGPSLYASQARAFLRGHLGLQAGYYDTAPAKGEHHVVNPPFPSLVLLPFVAALPQSMARATSTAVALLLTGVGWGDRGHITISSRALRVHGAYTPFPSTAGRARAKIGPC
jgi:hypothetical protein